MTAASSASRLAAAHLYRRERMKESITKQKYISRKLDVAQRFFRSRDMPARRVSPAGRSISKAFAASHKQVVKLW